MDQFKVIDITILETKPEISELKKITIYLWMLGALYILTMELRGLWFKEDIIDAISECWIC